jgi:hypothetical protein
MKVIKILTENLHLKIIALILGIFIWINAATDEISLYRLNFEVKYITQDLGDTLVILSELPQKISVTVKTTGKSYLKSRFSRKVIYKRVENFSHGTNLIAFTQEDIPLSLRENEIIKSRIYLESKLKIPLETFAYPYGLYSKEVIYMIKKAGYRAAFSVVSGMNTSETPRYALHRTLIFNSTGVEGLKKILRKKPIKVKEIYPVDSDVLEDRTPELRAFLVEDSNLNTATIKFKLNNKELKDVRYDTLTKKISCYHRKPLSNGAYVATINAKGMLGEEYEYSWLFVIGKPSNTGLYE